MLALLAVAECPLPCLGMRVSGLRWRTFAVVTFA